MRTLCLTLTLLAALTAATGCLSVKVGAEADHAVISASGLVSGYLSFNALPPYQGEVIDLGILAGTGRAWELAHLDVWPVGGIGLGLVGFRARLLMVEAALGTLIYHPAAPYYYRGDDPDAGLIDIEASLPPRPHAAPAG